MTALLAQAAPYVARCTDRASDTPDFPLKWADAGAPARFATCIILAFLVVAYWRFTRRKEDDQ